MKLPINLTPAKALEILRAYFPKADGYSISISCAVREYPFSKEVHTDFYLSAWLTDKPHIQSSGPTLSSALSLILEGREPVKLFTEDPEAVHFFKSAEDDAEALRLAALSVGATAEDWPRYARNKDGDYVWHFTSEEEGKIWSARDREWSRSICDWSDFSHEQVITRSEALKLTGGAL